MRRWRSAPPEAWSDNLAKCFEGRGGFATISKRTYRLRRYPLDPKNVIHTRFDELGSGELPKQFCLIEHIFQSFKTLFGCFPIQRLNGRDHRLDQQHDRRRRVPRGWHNYSVAQAYMRQLMHGERHWSVSSTIFAPRLSAISASLSVLFSYRRTSNMTKTSPSFAFSK